MKNLDMIKRDLMELKGANVRIFGQPVTLEEEFGELTIDAIEVIDALMDYEVINFMVTVYDEENDDYDDVQAESIEEYLQFMDEEYDLKETKSDNSYNWSSPITHDFYFHTYESDNLDKVYITIAFHMFGDVRGNYTNEALLEFDSMDEFYEVLLDSNKYLDIKGCHVEVDIFNDVCEVYTSEGDYLGHICDVEDIDELIS